MENYSQSSLSPNFRHSIGALPPQWQYLFKVHHLNMYRKPVVDFKPDHISSFSIFNFQFSIKDCQIEIWQSPGTLNVSSNPPNVNFRVISTTRLCRHRLYTCGLSTSSSTTTLKGDLILRQASRLDAFSAYPVRAWLPGRTTGVITGSLAARPTRSSRTRVRTSRISNAHDR